MAKKGLGCLGALGALCVVGVAIGLLTDAGKDEPPPLTPEQQRAKEILDNPALALDLEFTPRLGGFGTVLILSGKITNSAGFAIKDPVVRCTTIGASGTPTGPAMAMLTQVVPAKGSVTFREFNMGRIEANQAVKYACGILGATATALTQ